jgi:hypothetical protein
MGHTGKRRPSPGEGDYRSRETAAASERIATRLRPETLAAWRRENGDQPVFAYLQDPLALGRKLPLYAATLHVLDAPAAQEWQAHRKEIAAFAEAQPHVRQSPLLSTIATDSDWISRSTIGRLQQASVFVEAFRKLRPYPVVPRLSLTEAWKSVRDVPRYGEARRRNSSAETLFATHWLPRIQEGKFGLGFYRMLDPQGFDQMAAARPGNEMFHRLEALLTKPNARTSGNEPGP